MFSSADYDKFQQITEESPEKKELLTRLLESHQAEISTISHEIRNPLTLVYSTLQLIETQHPEVWSFCHWESMHQDIEYMKLLLEELSSYNNGMRLILSPVNADTFFKSLVLSFAASVSDTRIEFSSKIAAGLPVILADPVKLKQALLNLLTNARDAVLSCPEDSLPAITFDVHIAHEQLQITITDSGCGIHSEDIPAIFEPFVTHKPNGTGLGLAITKRIIIAHGGTVNAESSIGHGSTFTVFIPTHKDI